MKSSFGFLILLTEAGNQIKMGWIKIGVEVECSIECANGLLILLHQEISMAQAPQVICRISGVKAHRLLD